MTAVAVAPQAPASAAKKPEPESIRDTVESIIFALLMAFLFRTFEAEAFVIPTGSMAPTLYGRHKEANCEKCGFPIVIGASDELDDEGRVYRRIETAVCPNCAAPNDVKDALPYNGDRILVNKYPYEFGEPDRWDVFVFKNPDKPVMNYIKRLVGLPGDTIRIRQGDLYKVVDGEAQILRKAPEKQRHLQIPVYDDRYPPHELLKAGWPERWAAVDKGPGEEFTSWTPAVDGWKHDAREREFRITEASEQPQWIRYRHYFPSPEVWATLKSSLSTEPKPQLIADNCGYNNFAPTHEYANPFEIELGSYWCNDLTLSGTVQIDSVAAGASLILELNEGIYSYRCKIDPSNGMAVLSETVTTGQVPVEIGSQKTAIKGAGTYEFTFSCVDDRLLLWINGDLVDFGPSASLIHFPTADSLPISRDLTPIGIAASGMKAAVRDLVIERDVYYRTANQCDGAERDLSLRLADVESWCQAFLNYKECQQRDIQVDPDGFLAMGDNSPRSLDSRLWTGPRGADIDYLVGSVPREYLVGKAFWIYWPHGVPFMNGGKGYTIFNHTPVDPKNPALKDYPKFTVPFYPQVGRMKRIR
jgi:signal peptidase I